jgi:hypothetical protein
MTRNWQVWLQLAATFLQVVVTQIPSIPPEWTPVIHGGVAFCQMAIAIIGHGHNPDGTPAQVAYIKE